MTHEAESGGNGSQRHMGAMGPNAIIFHHMVGGRR